MTRRTAPLTTDEQRDAASGDLRPANAEGRDLTTEESRAVFDAVMSCIGEDVTDRTTSRDGDRLVLDRKEVGPVE